MNLTDNQIIDILTDYIKNPKMNYAILLDGEWGSGKTYFIKNKFEKDNKNVIYIPLYGIKNREDIDKKIYYKILEKNMPTQITKSKCLQKGFKIAKKTGDAIFSITNEVIKKVFNIDVSGIKNITGSEIISLFKNISDYIIIFDDLERCEIPINEILGYINEYVEHRNVKCIIVANEEEINKINYDYNYELKVLSCLNNDIDYGDKQEEAIYGFSTVRENKKINIEKIKNRISNMYEGNKKYQEIKEKLIGITIKYVPDISVIYDELIQEYEKNNKKLYDFLKINKESCIDILKLNNCCNIRTIIFLLDRFEKLYNEINKHDIDKKDIIIDLVFKNIIFSSIGIKNGIDIRKVLSGAMCSNSVTLKNDLKQSHNNYYTAFNFVDDFIVNGNIDKDKMIKSIEYYLSINYEKIDENDPYNKIKIYWELEDEEIKESLRGIWSNIKNNKYNYQLFPKIIYALSCIENLDFEKEMIQNIIDEMGKYIEENKIGFIDFHIFARDEQVAEIYNKNIKKIKDKIEISGKNKNESSLKEIFNSEDWGIKLHEYIRKQDYLNKRQFLKDFDINLIVDKIKESNSKNIYYFKYCIDAIYNFSNLKDYFMNDLEKMSQLIEELDKMNKDNFGVTKKEAIEYLSEILKEKKKILEK